jgi:long-chain fatty acid transport protein
VAFPRRSANADAESFLEVTMMRQSSGRSAPHFAGLCAAAFIAFAPAAASAAGFAIFEQGARSMGFAGAFTAQSDPSAIFHNAAGIAFLTGRQAYAGGTIIAPSSTFTGADPFPGSAVTEKADMGVLLPPAAYYTHQFSERLVLGAGWTTPFGLETRWHDPDSFSGRFISEEAELRAFSLNPTVAYKIEDRLAVGFGVDVRFSTLSLTRRVPVIDPFTQKVEDAASAHLSSGTEMGIGFNVGVLARPTPSLSVGASYRHKVKVDYSADATFAPISTGNEELDAQVAADLPAGGLPVSTSITFPAVASFGAAYSWNDWTIEADVNWYQWSTFDRVLLLFETRPDLSQALLEGYSNSWQYRLGLEKPLTKIWAVRGGLFYDQSPAPAAAVSPMLPDADRYGLALGGSFRPGRFWIDAGSWIVLGDSRSTEGQSHDAYDGTYDSHGLTLGVSFGYAF